MSTLALAVLFPKEDQDNLVLLPSGKRVVITDIPLRHLHTYISLLSILHKSTPENLPSLLQEHNELLMSCVGATLHGAYITELSSQDVKFLVELFFKKNILEKQSLSVEEDPNAKKASSKPSQPLSFEDTIAKIEKNIALRVGLLVNSGHSLEVVGNYTVKQLLKIQDGHSSKCPFMGGVASSNGKQESVDSNPARRYRRRYKKS